MQDPTFCRILVKVGEINISVLRMLFNPIALRMAKALWSFGHSECNKVNEFVVYLLLSFLRLLLWNVLTYS